MTYKNKDFKLGKWLINIRRVIQSAFLILFFFLLFHTQKVKELEIPTLNYIFVLSILFTVFYLAKYIYLRKKQESSVLKILLIKLSIFFLTTFIIGSFLLYYNQFEKPDRINYISNESLSIQEAISKYEEEKKLNESLKDFSAIKTKVDSSSTIIIKLPKLIIYLNYFLLILSLVLAILGTLYYKNNKTTYKAFYISSALILFSALLFFFLLEFDFKKEFIDYKASSIFILHYFPTDLTHYDFFFSIPQNIFLKLSPFLGIVSSIALWFVVFGLIFILFFLIISFVFGRVFCGWVCPFGTIHQIVSFIKMKVNKAYDHELFKHKQNIKYAILIVIIITAVFSINLSGFLDPIAILTKSTSIFLIPSAQYIVNTSYDPIQKKAAEEETVGIFTLLSNIYRAIKEYLDEYIFYFTDPAEEKDGYVPTHFKHFLLNGLLFIVLIVMNLKTTRFWCRYICPLGALLGIFANRSLMRIEVNKNCTSCKDCEQFCQGAADVSAVNGFKTSECMYCFNCMDACNQDALDITWTTPAILHIDKIKQKITKKARKDLPTQKLDIVNRRRIAKSIGYGLGLLLLFRSTFWARRVASSKLIRPPGSVREEEFLARCIKCSECMKVCPRNFLHPSFLEAGIEGMFTPIGIASLGYCEHTCKACMEVCPTDAIEKFPLDKKQEIKIGLAIISKDRCLTYASQTPCIVCEEHCPTSPKAIWTHKKEVVRHNGEKIIIDQINVEPTLCIGCGICEYVCPVVDNPAIYVSSIEETRSKENRLFLENET